MWHWTRCSKAESNGSTLMLHERVSPICLWSTPHAKLKAAMQFEIATGETALSILSITVNWQLPSKSISEGIWQSFAIRMQEAIDAELNSQHTTPVIGRAPICPEVDVPFRHGGVREPSEISMAKSQSTSTLGRHRIATASRRALLRDGLRRRQHAFATNRPLLRSQK